MSPFYVHCTTCRRTSRETSDYGWLMDKLKIDGWEQVDGEWKCPPCLLAIHTDATVGGWR